MISRERDLCNAGLDVLRSQPHVDPERLAVVGFCFGGQAALELGRSGAPLRAIVGFHSQLTTRRPEDSARIRAKVLVCLGNRDRIVSREDRESFMENMAESQVDCQLLLFAGVMHSFTDRHAEASGEWGLKYDPLADSRSWAAMLALFNETIGAGPRVTSPPSALGQRARTSSECPIRNERRREGARRKNPAVRPTALSIASPCQPRAVAPCPVRAP
jgi:Dienelactone hydrolase family